MSNDSGDPITVPPRRREAILGFADELRAGRKVVLSTHVNADGDGTGSECALAGLLAQRGMKVWIVNPTPWPTAYSFLLESGVRDRTADGTAALKGAELMIVLDIADVKRLGVLSDAVRALDVPKIVIDHHVESEEPVSNVVLTDPTACSTGELIFDLAATLELEITPAIATALYTAILTDTGGFRFSNTSPRAHAIAARLLARGVDPEAMYQRIYASVPLGRVKLLAEALQTLQVDEDIGLAWLSVAPDAVERHGLRSEDLDGIVEHPRSIAGMRIAVLFRDLGHGKVKVSFRSTGTTDVHRLAKQFGGGGHAKASGALIPGSIGEVETAVIAAARKMLNEDRDRTSRR
jgi:phosphoesterase RecJ-like protein